MLARGREVSGIALDDAIEVENAEFMWGGGQQLTGERLCRLYVIIQNQDVQIEFLSLEIARMQLNPLGGQLGGVLEVRLPCQDHHERLAQRHGRRIRAQRLLQGLGRFVEHSGKVVGSRQI